MPRLNDENFKDISIEAFDAIEENHEFSDRYLHKKQRLIRKYRRRAASGSKLHRFSLPTAATIAIICGISAGTVYAGVRAWKIYAYKTNTYQIKAGVTENANNPSTDQKTAKQESVVSSSSTSKETGQLTTAEHLLDLSAVPQVTVQVGYMPDGLTDNSAEKGGDISYTDGNTDGYGHGYVITTYIKDTDAFFSQDFVKDYQTLSVGGRDALYVESQNGGFSESSANRDLYIAFPEYQRIVGIWGWGNGNKDELTKIGENIALIPTGQTLTEDEQSSAVLWSTYVDKLSNGFAEEEIDEADSYDNNSTQLVKDADMNLHSLGESFPASDISNESSPVTAAITDVQLLDDYSPLSTETVEADSSLSMLLNDEGKLGTDEVIYFNQGNGTDSLGTTVKKEDKNIKFLYLTINYTNNSDQSIDDMISFGTLQSLIRTDDGWKIWNRSEGIADDCMHAHANVGVGAYGGDLDYIDASEANDHGATNHIHSLAPGETRTIHMGFLLDEDEAKQPLYVNLSSIGGGKTYLDAESLDAGFTALNSAAEQQKAEMS